MFKASLSSEIIFCFLYFYRAISVFDNQKKNNYWIEGVEEYNNNSKSSNYNQVKNTPPEIKEMLNTINKVNLKFDDIFFRLIKNHVEKAILSNPNELLESIKNNNTTPYQAVYSMMLNRGMDLLESGNYHIYRGVLNPCNNGPKILQFTELCIDELINSGGFSATDGETVRRNIREMIKETG